MSDVSLRLDFPAADLRALQHQMRRFEKELRRSEPQAVRKGAEFVAKSLGASTRVAKRFRPYKEIGKTEDGRRKYEVTSHKSGTAKTFITAAANVRELKKQNRVRIGKAGLAKASWMWGLRALGRTDGSKAGISRAARRYAPKWMRVINQLRSSNPTIIMHNGLNYIEAALRNGPQDVATAMERAARNMSRWLDGRIEKLGAK